MVRNNSGFRDSKDVPAKDLLVRLGPTLRVDVGFDPDYDGTKPQTPPNLPVKAAWALIDTGASICCIDAALAMHLNLPIIDQRTCSGISGAVEVNMHLAQIHAPSLNFTIYGSFAAVDLAGGQHPVLIGRDFLRHFKMTYDGPTGEVFLEDPMQPFSLNQEDLSD